MGRAFREIMESVAKSGCNPDEFALRFVAYRASDHARGPRRQGRMIQMRGQ